MRRRWMINEIEIEREREIENEKSLDDFWAQSRLDFSHLD